MKKNKFEFSFIVLGLIIIFLLILKNNLVFLDPDLGWHLRVGKDLLVNKIFPYFDIYSYTYPGHSWVDHEWLSDTISYYLFNRLGFLSLALISTLIAMGIVAIQSYAAKKFFQAKSVAVIISLLLSLLATLPFIFARSQQVTWLGLIIVQFYLFRHVYHHKNLLHWLPLVFFIWANLHGGFPIGLLLLLVFAIFSKDKKIWLVLTVSLLVTLITPYGLNLYKEIFQTITDNYGKSQIVEWLPLLSYPIVTYGLFYILVFIWLFWGQKAYKRYKIYQTIFLLLLLILSILSKRNLPLLVFYSLPFLAWEIQIFLNRLFQNRSMIQPSKITVSILILGFILIFISFFVDSDKLTLDPFKSDSNLFFPKAAVDFLERENTNGKIFSEKDYGGYLLWRLPNNKVFYDGRMSHWKDAQGNNYLKEYDKIISCQSDWQGNLNKFDVKIVLIPKNYLVNYNYYIKADWFNKLVYKKKLENNKTDSCLQTKLLNSDNWMVLYEDQNNTIYQKTD